VRKIIYLVSMFKAGVAKSRERGWALMQA